jgi:choline dehydrogenase-like flavoprotein
MSPSYNYIIAGAGSTGFFIANRITEYPDVNVLLLEFGWRNNSPRLKIPAPFNLQLHDLITFTAALILIFLLPATSPE